MDVVVPVTASCGPRAGQRAARGGRRRRRTDWGRKDRRTSPSWVSGAGVAGALGPSSPDARTPRGGPFRARLPGSPAPGSRARLRPRVPARARPLSLPDPEPLPARASPPAARFPVSGCWKRRRSAARTCRRSAAFGSPGAAGLSRELEPSAGLGGTSKRGQGH